MPTDVGETYDRAKDAISEFRAALLDASGGVEVAIDDKSPLWRAWQTSRTVSDIWDGLAYSVGRYEDSVEMADLEYLSTHKHVCIECGVEHSGEETCQKCTECGYLHHSGTSCGEYAADLAEYRADDLHSWEDI